MVSLCFLHSLEEIAFSRFRAFLALVSTDSMWAEKLSFLSKVRPSILGLNSVGSLVELISSESCVLYSAGSGMKRVAVHLSGLIVS